MTTIGVALVLALMPSFQSTPEPVEVVETFHAALSAGDGEAALGQLSPEVVIFEGGGAEMSRDEYASHHLGGDMQFVSEMEREVVNRQHRIVGDTAWVLSRTRTTGTFREREVDSAGVETMLLHRGEDGWKIVHIHWSSRTNR